MTEAVMTDGVHGVLDRRVVPRRPQTGPVILVDRELFRCGEIWAAAGTPHAVFRLTPQELCKLTGGEVVEIKAAQ